MNKRAFSTGEAAIYAGVSESLLKQGRMTGPRARRLDVPRHIKLGGKKIVYLKEDLDSWLDAHRDANGAEKNEVAA
jgi:predicted DNA-binding transcriptional regulator AlpA